MDRVLKQRLDDPEAIARQEITQQTTHALDPDPPVSVDAEDSSIDSLLDIIKHGTPVEQKEALDELRQQVDNAPDDPTAWNHLALGLQMARQFKNAIQILERLVKLLPEEDVYRLTLATNYSQLRRFESCRYHLGYLQEHARTEEMRLLATQQLEGMARFLRQTERDRRLYQLQLASLRERVGSRNGEVEDYVRLGRLLLMANQSDPDETHLQEATQVLEEGHLRFPKNVPLLELLIGCYSHHDPSNLLADAVDRLERLNPHSPILEAFSTNDDDATSQVSQMREQVYDLLEQAQEHGNRELQQAAVADLQRLVTISPANLEYRKVYAWALSVIGKKTEALEQAGILEQAGRTTHEFHFNLGQIFWLCGDPTKGRHHLHLARELATTEQERQDADERIADLTGQELT